MLGGLAIAFAVGWNVSNISAAATIVARDYGIGLAAVGLLTTIVFLVHTVIQIPAGRGADRYGPRRVGLAGLATLVVANTAALAARAPWLAFTTRTAVGVGTGLAFIAGLDYIRRAGGSPLVQGAFGGTPGAAAGLALGLVPQFEKWLHWQAPFLTAAVVSALALAALAWGPPDARHGPAAHHAAGLDLRGLWAVVRDARLRRLSAMTMASSGLTSVIGAWVVALLVEAGGYTPGTAGAAGALTLFGSIVTRPLSGWLVHRRPELIRGAIALSVLMGTGGTLLLAASGPVALAVVGSALVGLASGLPWTYAFTAAARARPDAPATALAVLNMSALIVIVGGVPLAGLTFSLPGHGRIGFVIVAALWAASILALPRRPTRGGCPVPGGDKISRKPSRPGKERG